MLKQTILMISCYIHKDNQSIERSVEQVEYQRAYFSNMVARLISKLWCLMVQTNGCTSA